MGQLAWPRRRVEEGRGFSCQPERDGVRGRRAKVSEGDLWNQVSDNSLIRSFVS